MNIVICVFLMLISLFVKNNSRNRLIVISLITVVLILQNALRPIEMTMLSANDTYRYYLGYMDIIGTSLSDIIHNVSFSEASYYERDPGYAVFVKLTQFITKDFTVYLFIVAGIIIIPLMRIIYKNVQTISGIVTSILIYESLFANFFCTAIRQTIAMGLMLMGYDWVVKKKYLKFAILVAISSTIHSSAWVFLPFAFFPLIKDPKKRLLQILALTPVIMFFAKDIIAFLGSDTIYSNYAVDSEDNLGTPVFSTLLVGIGLLTYFVYNKNTHINTRNENITVLSIGFAVALTPSSWIDSNFIRIVFYYALFIMIAVPHDIEALCYNKPYMKGFSYMIVNLMLLFFIIR